MAPDYYVHRNSAGNATGHCACNVTGCGCSRYSYDDTASNSTNYYVSVEPEVEFSLAEFLKSLKSDWREWLQALRLKAPRPIEPRSIELAPILWRPVLPRGMGIIPKVMRA